MIRFSLAQRASFGLVLAALLASHAPRAFAQNQDATPMDWEEVAKKLIGPNRTFVEEPDEVPEPYAPEGALTRDDAYLKAADCAVTLGMMADNAPPQSAAHAGFEAAKTAWIQSALKIDPDQDNFRTEAENQWFQLTGRNYTNLGMKDPVPPAEREARIRRLIGECQKAPPPTPASFPLPDEPAARQYYTMLRCEAFMEIRAGGDFAKREPAKSRAMMASARHFVAEARKAFPDVTPERLARDREGERELYFKMQNAWRGPEESFGFWMRKCDQLTKEQ